MESGNEWNLRYVQGDSAHDTRVTLDPSSPGPRSEAVDRARELASLGWRVWVEHMESGERIYESKAEKAFYPAEHR